MSQQRIVSIAISILVYLLPFLKNREHDSQVNALSVVFTGFLVLMGIVFGGWNVFLILFIYWIETAVLGLLTLIKMSLSGLRHRKKSSDILAILFFDGFFIFHFAMFMAVHLAFIALFQILSRTGATSSSVFEKEFEHIMSTLGLTEGQSFFTTIITEHPVEIAVVLALVIRLSFDFYYFQLRKIDQEPYHPEKIMMEPYSRVVHMHISIIFGGFALMATGFSGVFFAVTWVLIKTFVELKGPISLGKVRVVH